jgi:hypothetical protein
VNLTGGAATNSNDMQGQKTTVSQNERWSITVSAVAIAAPEKLPLFRTIGQAYTAWARNFVDLIRVCWLWMVLMAAVLAVWKWWLSSLIAKVTHAAFPGESRAHAGLFLMMLVVGVAIMLPALASAAVAWHRLLLKNEHPGPGICLRLDRIVVGYAVLLFMLEMIAGGPIFVSGVLPFVTAIMPTWAATSAVYSLALVALIIGWFIVPR